MENEMENSIFRSKLENEFIFIFFPKKYNIKKIAPTSNSYNIVTIQINTVSSGISAFSFSFWRTGIVHCIKLYTNWLTTNFN